MKHPNLNRKKEHINNIKNNNKLKKKKHTYIQLQAVENPLIKIKDSRACLVVLYLYITSYYTTLAVILEREKEQQMTRVSSPFTL